MTPNRRNDDDPSQVKTQWSFLSYMAKNHPVVCIVTPSLTIFVLMFCIWVIMNVSYTSKFGWRVTPRINVDIDINKEMSH
jgi:hypothetical protein